MNSLSSKRARILFVEDERALRRAFARLLERQGFRVDTAADGEEALEWLSSNHRYDLVVTDLTLPGISGLDVLERARALYPDLPALLMTGRLRTCFGVHPAVEVILKPFRIGELFEAIETALSTTPSKPRTLLGREFERVRVTPV